MGSGKVRNFFFFLFHTLFLILVMFVFREKYKISPCGLLDLQFTLCGIETNSKVPVVCKKNNLIPTVKFHPLI
jgi:hypothetical protein